MSKSRRSHEVVQGQQEDAQAWAMHSLQHPSTAAQRIELLGPDHPDAVFASAATSAATTACSASAPAMRPSPAAPLIHALTLVDRWFDCTADGRKTLEGRLWQSVPLVQVGDILSITPANPSHTRAGQSLMRRVASVRRYKDFRTALASLPSLESALPGVGSVEEGAAIYAEFYPEPLQHERGACFIESVPCTESDVHSRGAVSVADQSDQFEAVATERRLERLRLQQAWRSQGGVSLVDPLTHEQRHEMESYVQHHMDSLGQSKSEETSAASTQQPPQQRFLSLWLQPAPDSAVASQLSSTVSSLSSAHGQPPFVPHVTLATFPWPGGPDVTPIEAVLAGVGRAVDAAGVGAGEHEGGSSLRLRGEALGTHPALQYVTLVLLLHRSPALLALRALLWTHLLTSLSHAPGVDSARFPTPWPYMPHLSLLYDRKDPALSAAMRERIVEQECAWGGQRGREAFRGLEFDVGVVNIVETTHVDYAQWKVMGSVPLSTGKPAAITDSAALPSDAQPPSPALDRARFDREVLDRLDHSLYLRLCTELAPRSHSQRDAAVLVCDGQVVLSASAIDDTSAVQVLLQRCRHLRASDPNADGGFFDEKRLTRMLLYTLTEPTAADVADVRAAGVRTLIFGRRSTSDKEAPVVSGEGAAGAAASSSSALLLLGPLLDEQNCSARRI